jgi:hypothetical protein
MYLCFNNVVSLRYFFNIGAGRFNFNINFGLKFK